MKLYVAAALGVTALAGTAMGFSARRAAPAVIRRSSAMAMTSSADFAKAEIASNDVVVFSKAYCPFCTKTKQLLSKMDIEAKVIELDEIDNGAEIQGALLDISGQRTVPNVFVKGVHLGGNDDTQAAAKNGKLEEMLK